LGLGLGLGFGLRFWVWGLGLGFGFGVWVWGLGLGFGFRFRVLGHATRPYDNSIVSALSFDQSYQSDSHDGKITPAVIYL